MIFSYCRTEQIKYYEILFAVSVIISNNFSSSTLFIQNIFCLPEILFMSTTVCPSVRSDFVSTSTLTNSPLVSELSTKYAVTNAS
ncbi:MAG: hypothetical protein CM15mP90_5310 [Actinomycetota bacterium]|nr:MAG: hypothetical protein CM15mP90_5310 [Actinomycetota bacterium]